MTGSSKVSRNGIETGRYTLVAILLHWVIAIFILLNLFLGWRMGFLKGMSQFTMFQLHKSVGITVLLLSVLRLLWRLTYRAPPLPPSMTSWEHRAAQSTHALLYVMMIGMPLTGWAMVSVSPWNIPTLLWSHIPWPHIGFLHDLPKAKKAVVDTVSQRTHYVLAIGGMALIALHVAAALKHQFISKDGILGRMVPFLAPTSEKAR